MDRILKFAWAAFALSGAVCFSTIAYWAVRTPAVPDLAPLVRHGDGVLTRLEGIESKANATLINVDKATAAWAGSSSDQAASVKNLTQDAVISLQEAHGAIVDIRALVSTGTEQVRSVGPLLESLKATSDSTQPVLGQLALTTSASTRAIDALNVRIRDPKIDQLMAHLDGTMSNVEGITGSIDKMASHVEKKVDAPPTKLDKFKEWAEPMSKLVIWYFTK